MHTGSAGLVCLRPGGQPRSRASCAAVHALWTHLKRAVHAATVAHRQPHHCFLSPPRILQEITGVQVPGRRNTAPTQVTIDEPLRKFNRDKLQNLRPAFAGRVGQQSGLHEHHLCWPQCTRPSFAAGRCCCQTWEAPYKRRSFQCMTGAASPPGCISSLGDCVCMEGHLWFQDVRGLPMPIVDVQWLARTCRQAGSLHHETCCLPPLSLPM